MNTAIETYINSLFIHLPHTRELERARRELLQMSEDKYAELIARDVSPHEATGRVITEFGNLDELADDLGIRQALDDAGDASAIAEAGREEAERSVRETLVSSLLIAGGVLILLIALAVIARFNQDAVLPWPAVLLFAAAAVTVGMFIVSAFVRKTAAAFANRELVLTPPLAAEYERRRDRSTWKFVVGLVVGVGLIVLSFVPTVILQYTVSSNVAGSAFLASVGIGIGVLIVNGMHRSMIGVLAGSDSTTPTDAAEEQRSTRVGLVASVYWPLMVLIFLAWSFIGNAWDRSWIVWPIGGIGFGVIAAAMYAISSWNQPTGRD